MAALWAMFDGDERGLGPYFEAVGDAARSFERLVMYILLVSVYSVVLEVVVRAIQERILRRSWRSPALTHLMGRGVPALCYGLTHSIYHLPGVCDAFCLSMLTAAAYMKVRSTALLAAWHLLAIAGSLGLALGGPGAPRDHMIAAYKASQIATGTLVHDAQLGWIDRHHYDTQTYALALALARPSTPASTPSPCMPA